MRKPLLFLIGLVQITACLAQDHLPLLKIPNCVPFEGHHLYMAVTEVSNLQYREFEYWMKAHAHDSVYQRIRPDTMVWKGPLTYNEPFTNYYYQHTAYRDYPVIGINQQQAKMFCAWLRDRLLEYFRENKSDIADIHVRLPSTAEWVRAARGKLPASAVYPWTGEGIRVSPEHGLKKRDQGKILMNTRVDHSEHTVNAEAGFITTPVYSYWPNSLGLYNMSGNVAEWVMEKGKTKGGSWHTLPYYARLDVSGPYDGDTSARADVGFRYVVEIVKLKNKAATPKPWNARDIERRFVKADSALLGSGTEVSNADFRMFEQLAGLKQPRRDSLWLKYVNKPYLLMYSSYSAFDQFPAVNVTREEAEAYCRWLTDYYHRLEGRKYRKVVFRLPAYHEWYNAAQGGIRAGYPWGGPFIRNSRGCFLANHYPRPEYAVYRRNDSMLTTAHDTAEVRSLDGAELTCQVKSYFPNNYGYYNISGNAAEMCSDLQTAVGGSWNSAAWFLNLNATSQGTPGEHLPIPSPMVGFRVFMEILEK